MDRFEFISATTAFSIILFFQCIFTINIRKGLFDLEDKMKMLEKRRNRPRITPLIVLEDPTPN
jgi:hypothetical protein